MKLYFVIILLIFICIFQINTVVIHHVTNPIEFQQALDIAESNSATDFIFVAPGTYNLSSVLAYLPAQTEEYGLFIGGYTPNNKPVLDGNMSVPIMQIHYHILSDWSYNSDKVLICDMIFQNGKGYSGALYIRKMDEQIEVINNEFIANQSVVGSEGTGAIDIIMNTGKIKFINNIVSNNTGGLVGGVSLDSWEGGEFIVYNNTIIYNYGDKYGGLWLRWRSNSYIDTNAKSYILNNIIWGNGNWGYDREKHNLYSHLTVRGLDDPFFLFANNCMNPFSAEGYLRYCLHLRGNQYFPYEFRGGIFTNEPFLRLDFNLDPSSLCIDSGINPFDEASSFPSYDYFYNPRIIDGNNDGVPVIDIGASEYNDGINHKSGNRHEFRFVPGSHDFSDQNNSTISYLPMDNLIYNSDKNVGWNVSLKRKTDNNLYYSLHYSDVKEEHYNTGNTSNYGIIRIPEVDLTEKTNPYFNIRLFMDTDKGENKDILIVSVNNDLLWNKDEKNLKMKEWQLISIDMSKYIGKKVDIEIKFNTVDGDNNKSEGLYIDQLYLEFGEEKQ